MATPFHRVKLMGTFSSGEVWSCSVSFAGALGVVINDYGNLKVWADGITATATTAMFPTALLNLLGTSTKVTKVRIEYYDDAGLMEMAAESQWATAITGTGTPALPSQCAVVVSLITGRPGRSYAGRFYWPAPGATLAATTLRMSSSTTAAIASAATVLINALGAPAADIAFLEAVVVSGTKGENTPITSVRVGDVIDTQRRRRDALIEAYSTVPLGA